MPLQNQNIEHQPSEIESEKKATVQKEESKERFELPDLKDAAKKEYSWAKIAKESRKFLSKEITGAEESLKQLTEGVKEDTLLHNQIKERAKNIFQERVAKKESGTQDGDFFAAIEDLKTLNKTKLEMLNQRWARLIVLSSEKKGAQDEELNQRAYEKAEELRKKGREVNDIKCNDEARKEMLGELKSEIKDEDVEKEIVKREEDRVANLKAELTSVYKEMVGIREAPGKREKKEANEINIKGLYARAEKGYQSLTGENLKERVKLEAKEELAKEGYKIISKKEYFSSENINKVEKKIQKKRWESGVQSAWAGLSEAEKNKHNNDIQKFVEQLEKQREKLSSRLEKKGINLSKDVFYELMRSGYKPQDIKIKGWFRKRIVLPNENGEFIPVVKMKTEQFKLWTEQLQNKVGTLVGDETKKEMDNKFIEGRNILIKRRNRKLEEIINRAITSPEQIIKKGAVVNKTEQIKENLRNAEQLIGALKNLEEREKELKKRTGLKRYSGVNVQRTSGTMDDDWYIFDFSPENNTVRVVKDEKIEIERGLHRYKRIFKDVSVEDLIKWNGPR